jgi:hypothetical protein
MAQHPDRIIVASGRGYSHHAKAAVWIPGENSKMPKKSLENRQ